MKKVLFLMLYLLVLGTAGTNAQVRIGGDGEPHTAAVLDLNADDTDDGNKGALALPRVNLDNNTAQLNGTDPIAGMLVYNTNADITGGDGVGVYYWDGSQWVKSAGSTTDYTSSTSITLSGNSFQRAALTGDVTAAANSNATTIANNAVTVAKLPTGASSTTFLRGDGTWVTPTNTTYTGSTSITLSGTSFQRAALTGDVTAAANSNATTIANGSVNRSKTTLTVNSMTVSMPTGGGGTGLAPAPAGCTIANAWVCPEAGTTVACHFSGSNTIRCTEVAGYGSAFTANVRVFCFN